MARTHAIEVRRVLSSVISPSRLEQTAREAGFIRRARKVNAMAFFWTLVPGFGAGAEKSLASLRRCYALHTGTPLVPSAFYDRFTPALAQWLQRILLEVLQKSAGPARALGRRLSPFIDLMAIDGTVVRLHDLLELCFYDMAVSSSTFAFGTSRPSSLVLAMKSGALPKGSAPLFMVRILVQVRKARRPRFPRRAGLPRIPLRSPVVRACGRPR